MPPEIVLEYLPAIAIWVRRPYDPSMSLQGVESGAAASFTHLAVHSHYTLLGATAPVQELVAQAQADHMTHLALTDTNVLYGAVAFDRACRAAGVQPILGMTVTTPPPSGEVGVGAVGQAGRLVLLATGSGGYRSLCQLSSLIQGRPNREALAAVGLTWQQLKDHTEGVICLSGGRMGWIDRYLRAGNRQAASRYVAKLGGIYGENACLSLEIHQQEDSVIAQEIVGLGQRFGLPAAAIQPVYYLDKADAPRLRLLRAIDLNRSLDALTEELPAPHWWDYHWLHPDEVAERFAEFPGSLDQAAEIAARCQPALPSSAFQGWISSWPKLAFTDDRTPEEVLSDMAEAGLADRYGPDTEEGARQRLRAELSAINDAGYAPLFLIVADIVRYAREIKVPVSTRGSVANSLVAYCTDITTVDPIEHDLLFERFLNPARSNPPDIDLDFCSRRRDEILDHVRQKYGQQRVALVATISTMRLRTAVREVAKVSGLREAEISRLAKKLPGSWRSDRGWQDGRSTADLVAELDDPLHRKIVESAVDLIGQPHHLSVHPGGLIITADELTDVLPVQWAPKGFLITQFDGQDLESLGVPKLDLLGIRALTVLADAADMVRFFHQPGFQLDSIPLDDEATGDLLESGETIGVFQCESAGAQRTLRQLRTRSVSDLAVANAFFKPGPATGGMAQSFIRRYREEEKVDFLHPALEPILSSTKGVLLFQEQILRVATEIAGLSWAQADHLRRGMSKMQAGEMTTLKAQFVSGCCRPEPDGPGLSSDQAQTLWEQVMAFAGYGFNRGHATAYADVSYRSAYLKAHWPAAFLCARLADRGGFHHPAIYMAEAVRLGISVRPPHVNHSDRAFTLSYGSRNRNTGSAILWMGLGQVRDLRRKSIKSIVEERDQRPFAGLNDLVERVPLRGKEVTHLIQCGALDGLGSSRAMLLAQAEEVRRAGSANQMAFHFASPEVSQESAAERLAWELQLLGLPVSVHPLDLIDQSLRDRTSLGNLPEPADPSSPGRLVTVIGVRLPGWTGGPGFFLGDGQTFITAKGGKSLKVPKPWQSVRLRGRWLSDEWRTCWFQVEKLQVL